MSAYDIVAANSAETSDTSNLRDVLTAHGVRATAPRIRILELIRSRPETFTAEQICDQVPQVGRATVYRTLRLLQEAGAICKVVMPNGEMAYSSSQADPDDAHHHHAVCTECGSVRTFCERSIERAINAISALADLGNVVGHRIEVYDICQNCT